MHYHYLTVEPTRWGWSGTACEAVTSVHFAALISEAFDWLVTVDPHLHRRGSLYEIYSIPNAVVAAAPATARWIAGTYRGR